VVDFEWDPNKNAANIAKHALDFEDAISIFEGPYIEHQIAGRDYREVRYLAFGIVHERVIAVVYTLREGRRRIISARRASPREREAYRQAFA